MPTNVSQSRVIVGVFNSRFIHIKQHDLFENAFSQRKVKQIIDKEIFTVFTSFLIFLLISSSWPKIYFKSEPDLPVCELSYLIKVGILKKS